MDTSTDPTTRAVDDFYIAKINTLIAEGRESLIASLVEDHARLRRDASLGRAA